MAHPDLDQLLNAVLPFAKQMLSKHGEFFPFGSSMNSLGQVEAFGAFAGDELQPSQQILDLIAESFRQQAAAREIRAAAICYDVLTLLPGRSEKTDAICIKTEHQTGEAIDVYIPYKKGWFGKISYGEMVALHGRRAIFL